MSSREATPCMHRRSVLRLAGGGGYVATFGLPDIVAAATGDAALHEGVYPDLRVTSLSDLVEGEPRG